MKVKSERNPSFTPCTLSITIETKEEYDALKELFWHNLSVPDIVFPLSLKKNKLLSDLMNSIEVAF